MTRVLQFKGNLNVRLFQPSYFQPTQGRFEPGSMFAVTSNHIKSATGIGAYTYIAQANAIQVYTPAQVFSIYTTQNSGTNNSNISTNVVGSYCIFMGQALTDIAHGFNFPYISFAACIWSGPIFGALNARNTNSLNLNLTDRFSFPTFSTFTIGFNIGTQSLLGGARIGFTNASFPSFCGYVFDPNFTANVGRGNGSMWALSNMGSIITAYALPRAIVPISSYGRLDYLNAICYADYFNSKSLNYTLVGIAATDVLNQVIRVVNEYENLTNVQFDDPALNAILAAGVFQVESCVYGFIFWDDAIPYYVLIDPLFNSYQKIFISTKVPNVLNFDAGNIGGMKITPDGVMYKTVVMNDASVRVLTSLLLTFPWQTLVVPQIPPMALDCFTECLGKGSPQMKI